MSLKIIFVKTELRNQATVWHTEHMGIPSRKSQGNFNPWYRSIGGGSSIQLNKINIKLIVLLDSYLWPRPPSNLTNDFPRRKLPIGLRKYDT